jgi:DNA polymerase III alpha subunit
MADWRGIGCSYCTQLPKNDDVYGALQRADTVGMFQVESRSRMAWLSC